MEDVGHGDQRESFVETKLGRKRKRPKGQVGQA